MSRDSLRASLAAVDLFADLPNDVISDLLNAGVTMSTPAGRQVVEQGAAEAGLQVVLAGSAEVEVGGSARRPLRPGDYFGEISLVDGQPRSATVTAGEEGLSTFAISALKVSPLIDKYPALARTLLAALAARIRSLEAAGDA